MRRIFTFFIIFLLLSGSFYWLHYNRFIDSSLTPDDAPKLIASQIPNSDNPQALKQLASAIHLSDYGPFSLTKDTHNPHSLVVHFLDDAPPIGRMHLDKPAICFLALIRDTESVSFINNKNEQFMLTAAGASKTVGQDIKTLVQDQEAFATMLKQATF